MAVAWRLVVVAAVALLMAVACHTKYVFNCKFSNEGCDNDNECCSGKCIQAHPGTNARCTRSSLNQSCLYTYQCEDRLTCGADNTCCSKYWGTCSRHEDCCNPSSICIEAEGFYYKRCLMGRVTSMGVGGKGNHLLCATLVLLTFVLDAVLNSLSIRSIL